MKIRITLLLLFLSIQIQTKAQNIDLRLLKFINSPVQPADKSWRLVTNSLNVVAVAAPLSMLIVGLSNHDQNLTDKALQTGASIAIAGISSFVLKDITKRSRPYITYPMIITDKSKESGYSFPSGHTSVAFATATSLSLAFPKWYVIVPSYTYASLVGYSRLYLGVHYPSDVLAGAAVGAGSALLSWELQKLINKKLASRHYHTKIMSL